jgi:predicted deacylase
MSADELRVGILSASHGQKTVGTQPLTLEGKHFDIPIFLINGTRAGPTLVVTGGIHGAEYASIEAALRLGRILQPDILRGRVIIVPIVSMPMYKARSIYVSPLDGLNINRVFPGNAEGKPTEQLANWIFENVIQQGNYYVDLHGGDLNEYLVPFTLYQKFGDPRVDKTSLEMARVFGIKYLVSSEVKGSTVSAAAQVGIPGILTEAGGAGDWRHEWITAHTEGLDRLMRHLKMLPGPEPEPLPTQIMDQMAWLRSEHDGCWYAKVNVGDTVTKGQDLGHVADFAGNILQPVTAPLDGTVLFLVSTLAINKGDPLLSIGA